MHMMVPLTIDGRRIQTAAGTTLLKACLDNDIYIPNFCHMEGVDRPPASCRLCFVEIVGEQQPVTACTVRVDQAISVKTDTADVRRLQKRALQLLLSVHRIECKNCPANRQCALQDLARFFGCRTEIRSSEAPAEGAGCGRQPPLSESLSESLCAVRQMHTDLPP